MQQKLCVKWVCQSLSLSLSTLQINIIYFIYVIFNTTPFQATTKKKWGSIDSACVLILKSE